MFGLPSRHRSLEWLRVGFVYELWHDVAGSVGDGRKIASKEVFACVSVPDLAADVVGQPAYQ